MAIFRTKFPSRPSQPSFAKDTAARIASSLFDMNYGCRLIMNTLKTVIENAHTFEVSTVKLVLLVLFRTVSLRC